MNARRLLIPVTWGQKLLHLGRFQTSPYVPLDTSSFLFFIMSIIINVNVGKCFAAVWEPL